MPLQPTIGAAALLVTFAVVVLMLLPGASALSGLASLNPSAATSASNHLPSSPHSTTTDSASNGASQLAAATRSFEAGQGPARGVRGQCSPSSGGETVECDRPATVSNLSLAWSPMGTPLPRAAVEMVYDAADGYVVLFGDGADVSTTSTMADTWIFVNGQWSELSPTVAPSPRLGAYMTYYSDGPYVLLFGGWGGSYGPYEYGDTWAFSGGQWQLLIPQSACSGSGGTVTCPSARDSGVLADDPSDGTAILFGGYAAGLNDTWEFSHGKWIRLIASSSCTATSCPNARDDGAMAWDPQLDGDVLFGGGYQNSTWLFKGGSWKELISPSSCTGPAGPNPCPGARDDPSLSWDSSADLLVLFGGYNYNYYDFGDTWYLSSHGVWVNMTAATDCALCPAGRSGAGLADDPAMGGLLFFGGWPDFGDTWLLKGGLWAPVVFEGAPAPRWDASLAWDPGANDVLLFGGTDGSPLGDTWTFSNGTWTEVYGSDQCTASTCPWPSLGASLAWDGTGSDMVLFGGLNGSGTYQRNTWTFREGAWSEVIASASCTASTCPTARDNASMVWDSSDQEDILFGGQGSSTDRDTWAFKDGTWTEIIASGSCTSTSCPSARSSAPVAEAPLTLGGIVLFGGLGSGAADLNDTWNFRGTTWTDLVSSAECATVQCPSTRTGATMTYDPVFDQDILFGGENTSGALHDTWSFSGTNWTLQPESGPGGRSFSSLVWDGNGANMLLFGGLASPIEVTDTWLLGTPWSVATPTVSPNPAYEDLGQALSFSVSAGGGGVTNPWFTWQGLPPGCPAPTNGAADVSCTPTETGEYFVTVVAISNNGIPANTSNFLVFTIHSDPTVVLKAFPTAVNLGSNFTVAASVSGGTTPYTSYAWSGVPTGCSAPKGTSTNFTCDPTSTSDLGLWDISATVTDSAGDSVTSTPLALTISEPQVQWSVSASVNPSTSEVGQYVDFLGTVTGFSGGVTYVWSGLPSGCSGAGATVLCYLGASGTYTVTATATNASVGSRTSSPITLTVYAEMTTSISVAPRDIPLGGTLALTGSVSGGVSPYAYAWHGLPSGCTASNSAILDCQPSEVGRYNISLVVSDFDQIVAPAAYAWISVNATLSSVFLSASAPTIELEQATHFTASLLGSSTNASFDWLGLPSGCTGNSATVACTPTQTGSFTTGVDVTLPGQALVASNTVSVTVVPALGPLSLTSNTTSLDNGTAFMLSASLTGGIAPYEYNWSGLPTGCVAEDLPDLSCVPWVPASLAISLTVTDAAGMSRNASVKIQVNAAPIPKVTHPTNTTATSSSSGTDWMDYLLIVSIVVLGALVIVALVVTRRPPKGSASRSEWEETDRPYYYPSPSRTGEGGSTPVDAPKAPPATPASRQAPGSKTATPSTASARGSPPTQVVVASGQAYRPVPLARTAGASPVASTGPSTPSGTGVPRSARSPFAESDFSSDQAFIDQVAPPV